MAVGNRDASGRRNSVSRLRMSPVPCAQRRTRTASATRRDRHRCLWKRGGSQPTGRRVARGKGSGKTKNLNSCLHPAVLDNGHAQGGSQENECVHTKVKLHWVRVRNEQGVQVVNGIGRTLGNVLSPANAQRCRASHRRNGGQTRRAETRNHGMLYLMQEYGWDVRHKHAHKYLERSSTLG